MLSTQWWNDASSAPRVGDFTICDEPSRWKMHKSDAGNVHSTPISNGKNQVWTVCPVCDQWSSPAHLLFIGGKPAWSQRPGPGVMYRGARYNLGQEGQGDAARMVSPVEHREPPEKSCGLKIRRDQSDLWECFECIIMHPLQLYTASSASMSRECNRFSTVWTWKKQQHLKTIQRFLSFSIQFSGATTSIIFSQGPKVQGQYGSMGGYDIEGTRRHQCLPKDSMDTEQQAPK